MPDRTCSIDGCDKPAAARGWCGKHYKRWRSHGDPLVTRPRGRAPRDLAERFWEKVKIGAPASCWEWQAARIPAGYGVINVDGVAAKAHRVSVRLSGREIPGGYEVDHLCRNKRCVNPDHLDVVTPRTNTRRMNFALGIKAAKTHCPQGHPYSGDNLYSYNGRRYCRECSRQYTRNWFARNPRSKKSV